MNFIIYFYARSDTTKTDLKSAIISAANIHFVNDAFEEQYPFNELQNVVPVDDKD